MRRGGVPTGTEAFASSPCAIERLEPRTLCAGDAASESSPPLRVTEVYVSGSAWTPQFLEHLERRGMGLSPFGLRVYSWDSTPAPPVLPWVNLDRVTIRFNSTNMGVDPQDLTVRGARRPVYGFAGFEYSEDPGVRGTATWTLAPDASFRMWGDRLRLELNGDPPDGVNLSSSPGFFLDGDADGRPGGDFRLEFHVSPGDVITDGTVLPSDLLVVRRHIFRSTTEPGSFYQYHHLINIDGTGRIDLRDFVEVRRRVYSPPSLAAVPICRTGNDRQIDRSVRRPPDHHIRHAGGTAHLTPGRIAASFIRPLVRAATAGIGSGGRPED